MESIQTDIDNIKTALNTQCEDVIMETIKNSNPIIVMYYMMMNESIKYYTDKLPKDFFDVEDNIDMFIDIDDAAFVVYAINQFNDFSDYIIQKMVKHYIETNDIDNLKIMNDNICFADDLDWIIEICITYNNPEALKIILTKLSNNNNLEFDDDSDHFKTFYCSHITEHGDMIDIIKIIHEFSNKFPHFSEFDFNLVFNGALMFGRNKCMHYALNNGTINYYNEDASSSDTQVTNIFQFNDSIMFAIMGKNMNCVETVFEMFKNKINDNWEVYFKFAAVYGTLDIIKYMITIKPYLVEQIDNFYTNILQFALCNGNLDIIKFAMDNGATFSNKMIDFVEEYNSVREPIQHAMTDDYLYYTRLLYYLPNNINKNMEECMLFIHNY